VFFWSFPSKAVQASKNRLADAKAKVAEAEEKEAAMSAQLTAAQQQRQPTKERKVKLERLHAHKKRKRTAEESGKEFEHCDPERLKKLSQPHDVTRAVETPLGQASSSPLTRPCPCPV
jgi:DNA anti-recombination protein RmuC